MEGKPTERWRTLCELAAKEQDPAKLLELVTEINRLLDKKKDHAGEPAPGNVQDSP
jgi:hypothetical protein